MLAPPALVTFVSRAKREVSVSPRTTTVPIADLVERAKKRSFLIEILLWEGMLARGLTICGRRQMTLSGRRLVG
jgi:hypothetical protein